MEKIAEPRKDRAELVHFIECLKDQMKDGVDISRIFNALMQSDWQECFARVSIEKSRNVNVAPLIGKAVASNSPAMFEIALNLSEKRLKKGIVHHIWTTSFRQGNNAILTHLLDKRPVELCAMISQSDLFTLLCSLVKKVALGAGQFQMPNPCFWQEVELPPGITRIPHKMVWGCEKLTSVNIPCGVTKIGEHAFAKCTSLANVNIPSGVTEIGQEAFAGCTSLENKYRIR